MKMLGDVRIDMLVKIFNAVFEGRQNARTLETQYSIIPIYRLVPYREKGNIQECKNYRGIKLLKHTFKLWEWVIDGRLKKIINIAEDLFDFVAREGTTDAVFVLRLLM